MVCASDGTAAHVARTGHPFDQKEDLVTSDNSPDEVADDPEFEAIVAAFLKVSPEGITDDRTGKATQNAEVEPETGNSASDK